MLLHIYHKPPVTVIIRTPNLERKTQSVVPFGFQIHFNYFCEIEGEFNYVVPKSITLNPTAAT